MDAQARLNEIDRRLYRNNQFIRSLEAKVPMMDPYSMELENLINQILQIKDENKELSLERIRLLRGNN